MRQRAAAYRGLLHAKRGHKKRLKQQLAAALMEA